MTLDDKRALQAELLARLEAEHATLVNAQRLSSEGVTHADARSDGSKDMRSTEASYIARGQALRAEALEEDVAKVRAMKVRAFPSEAAVALSAVVEVEDEEGERRVVFVAPAGGGETVGDGVQVVTPRSPLGRALVGAREGDVVELERGGATSEIELVGVT